MSETIRDQALKAALSILDAERKIAFVSYKYPNNTREPHQKPNYYTAKVTIDQAKKILEYQQLLDQPQVFVQEDGKVPTIEEMIQGTKVALGEEKKACQFDRKIYGVILDSGSMPKIVEIVEIFGYQKLAGLETGIENLKYLTAVLDRSESKQAIEIEEKIVDAVTTRLQQQFSTQYAQNLLGQEGYSAVLSLLDKPQNNL